MDALQDPSTIKCHCKFSLPIISIAIKFLLLTPKTVYRDLQVLLAHVGTVALQQLHHQQQ